MGGLRKEQVVVAVVLQAVGSSEGKGEGRGGGMTGRCLVRLFGAVPFGDFGGFLSLFASAFADRPVRETIERSK